MAAKKAGAAKKEARIVNIAELAEKYGMEPREVRVVARKIGLKAPETDVKGFGPRAKYVFEEGSEDLKKLCAALEGKGETAGDAGDEEEETSKGKGSKKSSKKSSKRAEDEDEDEGDEGDEGDEE